ncbi:GPW/gp25 family protein [Emticicia soli]|uniref:GPW/gp25 family protein n=1 Tax=Emticicia soli TaxID=2027878 RepID=A0ABW5J3M6_9BACT
MKQEFYTLPLRFDLIIEKRKHEKCQLELSIAQHLHIMLTTHYRESRYDYDFGCGIWERDFELMTDNEWLDNVRDSIITAIRKNEPRLTDVNVQVEIEDFIEDYKILKNLTKKVRKRLWIKVDAFLVLTNKPFSFNEYIFIAPIAVE